MSSRSGFLVSGAEFRLIVGVLRQRRCGVRWRALNATSAKAPALRTSMRATPTSKGKKVKRQRAVSGRRPSASPVDVNQPLCTAAPNSDNRLLLRARASAYSRLRFNIQAPRSARCKPDQAEGAERPAASRVKRPSMPLLNGLLCRSSATQDSVDVGLADAALRLGCHNRIRAVSASPAYVLHQRKRPGNSATLYIDAP